MCVHIDKYITWHFSMHVLYQPYVISGREQIHIYDMFFIYFNRGNNWFVSHFKHF